MQSECFYIMLSDNSHDVAFVYMIQKKIELIKATLPNIKILSILLMVMQCNTRIITLPICATIRKILGSMQNGISLQQVMVNNHVMT